MATRKSVNVSLTPALQRYVNKRVASGQYQSASEVIREGLRTLQQREQELAAAREVLHKRIVRARAQVARGQVVTPEQFLEKLAKRRARIKGRAG